MEGVIEGRAVNLLLESIDGLVTGQAVGLLVLIQDAVKLERPVNEKNHLLTRIEEHTW